MNNETQRIMEALIFSSSGDKEMTEYANTTDSVKTVENEAAAAKYWHDMYVATSLKLETEVSALHTEIDTLHKILITRTEQIVGLQDEIRNLTGEE